MDNCSITNCIANTGGDAAGAVTFHYPPPVIPLQYLLQECQFINNKLIASLTYGGAGIHCTTTYDWMNEVIFIAFCFFDGNTATDGRGNDVFFNGSITKSPFNQCGSTTESNRVWNAGTADNVEYNNWLPLITTYKIVSNNGTNTDLCGITQLNPCATIEFALCRVTDTQDASLTLLSSTFVPNQTLTFSAADTKITGNGTTATTIASSGIPQPTSSSSPSSSTSSSPDPSSASALFQQTQGSLTVSALAISHNSSNPITPILFHLSENSPYLILNTTTITGTTSSSSSITTPLFFLTAGSLALNHTAITSLTLNSQSIFHLTSLTAPLTLNSSNITDITSTASPTSLSDTNFSTCSVSEDTSSGGRGGALMIEFKDDSEVSESSFSMANVVFSANKASVGRDMYFVCESFVASVKGPLFAFMKSITQKDNSIVGHDRTEAFRDWDVDLFIFIDGFFDDTIYVDGTSGVEKAYCGIEKVPCKSVGYGAGHLKRTQNKKQEIILCANSSVAGCVDVGRVLIKAKEKEMIRIECQRELSGSEECILKTESLTEIEFIGIVVPSNFERTIASVIESSTQNGELHMKNCMMSVVGGKENTIEFSLIKSTGKMVELEFVTISEVKSSVSLFSFSHSSGNVNEGDTEQKYKAKLLNCSMEGCSLAEHSYGESPLMISSSVLLENSNFSNIENKGSGEGGVAKVTLQRNEELVIKSTNASSCSLSSGNGKGGFLYLNCQNCLSEKPFLFENVSFANNKAAIGKNMFILGKDFNSSVTNDSFNFGYSSMKGDNNLFVGSDDFHSNKDLFMFLIPYSSIEIFISSSGFDVARCGSEEEPCFTMWKGMENMEKEVGKKTIQVEGSTIIRNSFNVSNYQIKKSVKMGEEDTKAILNFEKVVGNQLEYFMENDVRLEFFNIQLQLTSGFDNSAKTIISNRGGELVIRECSFHSEAGVNNGFDCVFVDVIGGSVNVNDLSMESCNVGENIFVINSAGVSCHFVNVRVESLNESGGCLLLIKGSELTTKINEVSEEMSLNIDNSSFSGVKRSDNGSSILESKNEKKIDLVVNESNITEDKAETSEKGGAIFFTLGASGSMKMIDSTISQCSCTNGKGGGVYLATKERGDLNFTFVGMKFSANTAKVGNDIFIECFNITSQINERQFQFDLRENHYSRINAIYGRDESDYQSDTDLIDFVTIHQGDTIIVSSVNGSNERQCGTNTLPCFSVDYGLMHLTSDFISQMFILEESVIDEEINLEEVSLSSKSRGLCEVEVETVIERTREALISTAGTASMLRVGFVFDSNFASTHESLISPEGGILEIMNCSFTEKQLIEGVNAEFANIPFHIINMEKGELQLDGCAISNLILHESALSLSSQLPSVIDTLTFCSSTIKTSLIDIDECGQLTIKDFNAENISVKGKEESLISCLSMKKTMQLANCTMDGVSSKTTKGKLMKVEDCTDVKMYSCIFDGSLKEINEMNSNTEEEKCRWEGSLVDVVKSYVMMKDSTISNSPDGGVAMSGGNMIIEKGEFIGNNPSIEGYPSLRRNIICLDSGTLNVMSLKGGDGLKDNTSLWMLNEGCSFEGIASERDSSFFIPVLESVEAKEETDRMKLTFKGMLLVPCNLSFAVVKRKGEENEIEKYMFDENGFLSEREVEGSVGKDLIRSCEDEIEVSVCILFGNSNSPSSTNSFILKNASITPPKGDERNVESGKEEKSSWALVVIVIFAIMFLIVLIVSIIFIVRWRKAKNDAEDLREIVNDNIRKDPKAFEMVTMEMSPEAQWRRAEREAEKKNEENMKKRIIGKEMVHSESEEYLLAESGSTEYILGRDSDKIPDWALEKVDEKEEEEETRKRSPSPSISSTCSTDSDSTFVRSESLCPTTSSMSNLVDAMACSSPHEKLIVDLRDSLFMLLHGRNEKKEMAIGTLTEREHTAAQVLFWVANVALHSFDEMENPLSSLTNLSPHIVLFSEHMVICIVMHSDLLSSDDSDSSSISSTTFVTSASDDESDSLPSSAFEDEDDSFKKECLRWKAPELLMNKKREATKESVAFSIGMMLWECLTLHVPFGEYEAEIAGQKIVNGERPNIGVVECEWGREFVKKCVLGDLTERPSLTDVKRWLIGHFPEEAIIVTATDAIFTED
ncbi:uncharacterized protein MONOS_4080 [Monocercomonoides exilis]|uniref:uncharacterized protein n=1 Tax=Monocercomonoides exilis TaxID=2049356 RepID=UPI003559D3B8|nr:hypothetical protein MONOS_4080 [Monocercomonoides exilis]|eukprot:MONOS_4080.1-p1 / transcript=MONOS_4080.1 / gene=MONOS_4080 / organism=Monocercomonoides_exilis_PA203 / gene_product=unspecified product / transcript_product=unspecified product / location=Mono_scaffold00104:10483-17465(-) / protein_length=2125 / sequence_SO=supercontig / SO=protein_coding / is_pseudo=false